MQENIKEIIIDLVIGGKKVAAARRIPLMIIGDGKSTLRKIG